MTAALQTTWIDHIPAVWIEPPGSQPRRRLAIFLNGLSGTKESLRPYLTDLANAGFVALSFDCWEHGERATMTGEQVLQRTFGNFRRYMWVNIGQTALDTLRVIDWTAANLGVEPQVCMGGLSMGGDISVTAAGLDPRIRRVAAVGSTPDWLRPGMLDLTREGHPPLPTGTPDAYSRRFYELFNPITHLAHYAHAPRDPLHQRRAGRPRPARSLAGLQISTGRAVSPGRRKHHRRPAARTGSRRTVRRFSPVVARSGGVDGKGVDGLRVFRGKDKEGIFYH